MATCLQDQVRLMHPFQELKLAGKAAKNRDQLADPESFNLLLAMMAC